MDPILPIMEAKTFSTIKAEHLYQTYTALLLSFKYQEVEIDYYLDNI